MNAEAFAKNLVSQGLTKDQAVPLAKVFDAFQQNLVNALAAAKDDVDYTALAEKFGDPEALADAMVHLAPRPIEAKAAIARCREAGFPSMAADSIEAGLPASRLEARLKMAATVRGLAEASDLPEPEVYAASFAADPVNGLRGIIMDLQAQADDETVGSINGHVGPEAMSGGQKMPNANSVYEKRKV
ncbi:hypothetical protein [Methylohalobius crimeensis]|uniref:hypothetical protein n=1 Tax=Methylohalobius crimeensis TaxID=244365 RepID=UPI0003B76B39|nr:hypothetical protein [Methylohalobius crimeensis]